VRALLRNRKQWKAEEPRPSVMQRIPRKSDAAASIFSLRIINLDIDDTYSNTITFMNKLISVLNMYFFFLYNTTLYYLFITLLTIYHGVLASKSFLTHFSFHLRSHQRSWVVGPLP
jgi:hypothetical protein